MSVIKRSIEHNARKKKEPVLRETVRRKSPVAPLSYVKGKEPLIRYKMVMKALMRFEVSLLDAEWHRDETKEREQKVYEKRLRSGRIGKWITASKDAYSRIKMGQPFTITFGIIRGRHTKTGRYLERCDEFADLLIEVMPKYGFTARLVKGTNEQRLILTPMEL
jgi:hypothetical protein